MPYPRRLLTAAALFAGAAAVYAQAPPSFRSAVEAVEVDAFVVDRAGNPVTNLTRDDFEILEDGKPQPLTSFSLINIPIGRPEPYSPTAPEPDVATNQHGEGRLYVIAFDELCATVAQCTDEAAMALRARHFLRQFIEERFEPNDVGIVVSLGRARAGDMQDFTNNRRLLLKAVDSYGGGFGHDEDSALPTPQSSGPSAAVLEQRGAVRSQARAFRDLMESLANIKGRRKTVIYITHNVGEDSNSPDTMGGADVFDVLDYRGGVRSLQFDDLRAGMTAAMKGGVAIYAVDPAWLEAGPSGADGLGRVQSLRALSSATGGFAVANTNNFAQAFTRIVEENSTYYLLGYTSSNDKRDGRYRKLQVRVKRPGLTVRNRDGYIAPSKNPPPAKLDPPSRLAAGVREAIGTPLANGSVPMSVFATALRGRGGDADVVISVEMDVSRLGLRTGPAATTGEVEVAAVAVSAKGKMTRGQQERFALNLKPASWERAQASGLRLLTGLSLPPGRYQLRIAGGNVASPNAGSVMYDLDVPDFGKQPLAMSAPMLASLRAPDALTVAPAKSVRADLPHVPTASRDFAAGDTLSVYAEAYDGKAKEAHGLTLVAELRAPDGTRIGRQVADTRRDGQPIQKFEAQLPLDIPAGSYVLHVEARSTLAKQPPVSRDIPIRVRSAP